MRDVASARDVGKGGNDATHHCRLAATAIILGAATSLLACTDPPGRSTPPCGDSLTVPLDAELLRRFTGGDVEEAPCRPAASGELLINEVVTRPAGRDLDGDGKSSGRDEAIELVSLATEQVHVSGTELSYKGESRGKIMSSGCVAPFGAVVVVGATTGHVKTHGGAIVGRLNKTLRLTDSGGTLALRTAAGNLLDSVEVPAAKDETTGAVTRRVDGHRGAPLVPHGWLTNANGATWSPGTCADGGLFPDCVPDYVVDREAWLSDPMTPPAKR